MLDVRRRPTCTFSSRGVVGTSAGVKAGHHGLRAGASRAALSSSLRTQYALLQPPLLRRGRRRLNYDRNQNQSRDGRNALPRARLPVDTQHGDGTLPNEFNSVDRQNPPHRPPPHPRPLFCASPALCLAPHTWRSADRNGRHILYPVIRPDRMRMRRL